MISLWLGAFLCSGAILEDAHGADNPQPSGGTVILDGTGYFRQHTEFGLLRLSSDVLKSEGEKLLGSKLKDVERTVKRLLQRKGYDWSKTDWRDVARYHFPSIQTGDDSLTVSLMESVPPPRDWMKPGFDDTAFLRQKIGTLTPVTPGWGIGRATASLHRQGLYLRTYFEIPDPAKAGALSLKISYRGGARVFLNGEEIGRGDLPKGEVTPDTFGADYPIEAYWAVEDELSQKKVAGPWIGDLRCPFDQVGMDWRVHDPAFHSVYGGTIVNRKGWERLMALRDRVLGPIAVPGALLKKGTNVLAIEIRSSRYHPAIVLGGFLGDGCNFSAAWDHLRLTGLELRSSAAGIPSCVRRQPGVTAWVDDMHNRLFSRDFNPAGWPVGRARFVAAQNGTFAAQIGVSTDKELKNLRAVCTDLAGEGGRKIPASAVAVNYMIGHGLNQMSKLGWFRSIDNIGGQSCPMSDIPLYRYAEGPDIFGGLDLPPANKGPELRAKRDAMITEFLERFQFFDHISPEPPESVPANACQPLWLALKVPENAAPGVYKGSISIQADGEKPLVIPVEADVAGWRVPAPLEFQTLMESEQSPYGVARAYRCDLWSDRHFELTESSFRQLARIGNDWIFVPVILNSEFGNKDDAGPIKWIRRKDGALSFDYTLLDRYLNIALKHLGKPKVIAFVVMHGCAAPTRVKILDEASGKVDAVEVGPPAAATRAPLWKAFASALYAHMASLNLQDAMYWGHTFDDTFDKALVGLMSEVTPSVGWCAGAHGRKPDPVFRAVALAYGMDLPPDSMRGWKNPYICLLMPRTGGSIICVEGIGTPFTWRVMCDRAIVAGLNGLGRMGADYFDLTWFSGVGGGQYLMVGRPCVQTLWPGKKGVETGARNETMLEGMQEAEARIFLEQALERKSLPEDLAREIEAVLSGHYRATLYIAVPCVDYGTMDVHGDWQGRSRRLFAVAARAAKAVGMDVDRTVFGQSKVAEFAGTREGAVHESVTGAAIPVPALGKARLALKLRNWTDKPRAFKAVASDPWIAPDRAEGTVTGHQTLTITLDGKTLKPGSEVSGTLTVTDAASNTAYPVAISAKVTPAFEFKLVQEIKFRTGGGAGGEAPQDVVIRTSPVFNVAVGGSESKEYPLFNNTAERQPWKIESADPGLMIEPASGELPSNSSLLIRLTARPKDKEAVFHESALKLIAARGAFQEEYKIKTYVIAPYQAPALPQGEAVFLNDLDQGKFVKSHMEWGTSRDERKQPRAPVYHRTRGCGENLNPKYGYKHDWKAWEKDPFTIAKKPYTRGLWVSPQHETSYSIEGAGFSAFAAEVGFFDGFGKTDPNANTGAVVYFEIYVDGKMRAASGAVKAGDAPILMAADKLQTAREIKLLTRRDDLSNDGRCLATWADARFIRAGQ